MIPALYLTIAICFLAVLIFVTIRRIKRDKRLFKYDTGILIFCILIMGLTTYKVSRTLYRLTTKDAPIPDISDVDVASWARAVRQNDKFDIDNWWSDQRDRKLEENFAQSSVELIKVWLKQNDSVNILLHNAHDCGENYTIKSSTNLDPKQYTFHKTLEALLQNPIFNSIVEKSTISSLAAASEKLSGGINQNAYRAVAFLTNEFLKLEITKRENLNHNFIRIVQTNKDSDVQSILNELDDASVQQNEIVRMEYALIETIAAIPEDYDGTEYEEDFERLKNDVDILLSEISK